jgi:hypothetical protein
MLDKCGQCGVTMAPADEHDQYRFQCDECLALHCPFCFASRPMATEPDICAHFFAQDLDEGDGWWLGEDPPHLQEEFWEIEFDDDELSAAFGPAKQLLGAWEDGLSEHPNDWTLTDLLLEATSAAYQVAYWEVSGSAPVSWMGRDFFTTDESLRPRIRGLLDQVEPGFDKLHVIAERKRKATGE